MSPHFIPLSIKYTRVYETWQASLFVGPVHVCHSDVYDKSALAPMNKFARQPHGYIVYLVHYFSHLLPQIAI